MLRLAYARLASGLLHDRSAPVLLRLFGPRLLGRLMAQIVEVSEPARGRPTVLCFGRKHFDRDLEELRSVVSSICWLRLKAPKMKITQRAFMPPELQHQCDYYGNDRPEFAEAWRTGEIFAETFLSLVRERHDLRAVVSANVDYWHDEVVRRACRKLGIPFLVLSRELRAIPASYQRILQRYIDNGFRYTGTAVAVFGEVTRDLLVESGACPAEAIWLTGSPRFDPWLADDKLFAQDRQDTITLLGYSGPVKANENYVEVLRLFAAAERRHRDKGLRWLVKCKDRKEYDLTLEALKGVEHGLVINYSESFLDLYPRSRLIVGYNSLAALEALLSGAALVVPQWSDARKPQPQQLLDPADPLIRRNFEFPETPAALDALIDDYAGGRLPELRREERLSLLRRYIEFTPGRPASERLEAFVLHHVGGGAREAA